MAITQVGVVGAGVIGIGVAQSLAEAGYQVVLVDVRDEILRRAKDDIERNLRFGALLKSTARGGTAAPMQRITFTTDSRLLAGTDFVVENTTEKWEVKRDVYAALECVCPPQTILAANTSTIPITRIASLTSRPDRIVGMHFMNPVPLKRMVEVVRGYHTSEKTIEAARELAAQMGKEVVVVSDSPGFVTNRVLMLMVNEAAFLVQEGVARVEEVDLIFRECFGHKMGPLETADLIGIDTILLSVEGLYESFSDSKYRPCPLLKRMAFAGLLGRKSGEGFYKYQSREEERPAPKVASR